MSNDCIGQGSDIPPAISTCSFVDDHNAAIALADVIQPLWDAMYSFTVRSCAVIASWHSQWLLPDVEHPFSVSLFHKSRSLSEG